MFIRPLRRLGYIGTLFTHYSPGANLPNSTYFRPVVHIPRLYRSNINITLLL